MESFFSKSFFTHNREQLKQLCKNSLPIVLTANGVLQQGGDSAFEFHQEATFWYLTGINEPDLILVIEADTEYLILPNRTKVQDIFDGVLSPEELSKTSGIKTALTNENGWKLLKKSLLISKQVSTLPVLPHYVENYGFYTNPARDVVIGKLKQIKDSIEIKDLTAHIVALRSIKQEPELKAIRSAIAITTETIKGCTANGNLSKYDYEYQLEADITRGFRTRGADGHGFSPIVASGKNACTMHYTKNNQKIPRNGLVLLDIGAGVSHYSADISRVFSVSQSPSSRQEAVHSAVLDVQAYAMGLLKPGVIIRDYESEVRKYMAKKLKQLGLIAQATVQNTLSYFPTATSHFLGLEVHDAGEYNKALKSGMVMTVEPGIYIAEEGIGVRIEDDVLITKTGIENLSSGLPASLI